MRSWYQWALYDGGTVPAVVEGVPVPYPVQLDGTEILMEFIDVDVGKLRRVSYRCGLIFTLSSRLLRQLR